MSNWVIRAVPKVSAVIPVPSEITNTVRVCMGRLIQSDQTPGVTAEIVPRAYNGAHYSQISLACRPTADNQNIQDVVGRHVGHTGF